MMAADFLPTSSTDKAGFGGQVEAGVLLGLTAEKKNIFLHLHPSVVSLDSQLTATKYPFATLVLHL